MILNDLSNAIRFLSIDSIEKAQSGHPGMPLGSADIATVLWKKFLKHNPKNPNWINRDRFILSNGHGSILLYSLLHLTGYEISIKDLKNFRQLHSNTPGHPDHLITHGVEVTTGPLGQGLASAVGIALAEKILSSQFNRDVLHLINHYTYVFVGDGCIMEGISHESCSLAGTLSLGKLIVFYDNNGISIDGKIKGWCRDNTKNRFLSYNWQVIGPINGHNFIEIEKAIHIAKSYPYKPSLIICNTIIGFGSPLSGSEKCHGFPLGKLNVQKTRENLRWKYPPFIIPKKIYKLWNHLKKGKDEENSWLYLCNEYKKKYKSDYYEFIRRIHNKFPDNIDQYINTFIKKYCFSNKTYMQATRDSIQLCIKYFTEIMPEIIGGSSDLTESNKTKCITSKIITNKDFSGNYIHYGARELAMSSIMNGLSLYRGFIPYGGTFLVFSDYSKSAIRLSALMKQRVIYIFTHDSIGVGEDGPTHQPIEHITMLRLIPNLYVWRPADITETTIAWIQAIKNKSNPSCLLLSRQQVPKLPHKYSNIDQIKKGGYIIYECLDIPEAILIATGSEVQLAIAAAKKFKKLNRKIRVVSMPCCEIFIKQKKSYKDYVLPPAIKKRIAIEAGHTSYWYKFVGFNGYIIGVDRFGISSPYHQAFKYFNITIKNIIYKLNILLMEK